MTRADGPPAADPGRPGRSVGRGGISNQRAVALLPYVAAVVVTLFVCRGMLVGRYFGDVGDARWTVTLHEHWFRVWQGKEAIRDLDAYVPMKSVLGTSDAFLVQGQIYSVLRAVGVDLAPAWAWTQILVFLIGALGVAALSRRLLRWAVSQAAFTVLVCSSYPFVVDLVHVQLIGMLSCAWVLVGIVDLARGRHLLRALALVLLVPPLIALSSWYAVVLLAVILAFFGAFLLVFSDLRRTGRGLRQVATGIVDQVRRPRGAALAGAALICSLLLWAMTAWIYLPAKNLLPKPTWLETTLYLPVFSDLLNAGWAGGGIWGFLYARFYDPSSYNVEQPHGFTPVLVVAFMALGLYSLRRSVIAPTAKTSLTWLPGPRSLAAMWLATLSAALLLVVDKRGLSAFGPLFLWVPGMDSIRSPFRIQTFGYALAFLVVLRSVELIYERLSTDRPRSQTRAPAATVTLAVAGVVVAAIFVEGQRPFSDSWDASQLLNPTLVSVIPAVQASCDAVIVESGADEKSNPVIDATLLATLAGVDTPQGYGRAEPLGHPKWLAKAPELAAWMRSAGYQGRICKVTEGSTDVTRMS